MDIKWKRLLKEIKKVCIANEDKIADLVYDMEEPEEEVILHALREGIDRLFKMRPPLPGDSDYTGRY